MDNSTDLVFDVLKVSSQLDVRVYILVKGPSLLQLMIVLDFLPLYKCLSRHQQKRCMEELIFYTISFF